MLVLTRKSGQSVTLTVAPSDHPVEIHLLLISRNNGHVKFGIKCERDEVHILRDELIEKENDNT